MVTEHTYLSNGLAHGLGNSTSLLLTNRFRFDWHSRAAFSSRMHHLMTADWESEAAQILESRLAGKETQGRGGGANLGIFVV